MITPDILRIIYVLGTIIITLLNVALVIGGIASIIIYQSYLEMDTVILVTAIIGIIIIGLILLLLINLLFRMYCEQIILFFSMHEILEDISENTGSPGKKTMKGSKKGKTTTRKVELDWNDDDDD